LHFGRSSEIFKAYLQKVKKARVIPIVVFDGLPLPAKAEENDNRRR
jgi:5'-3' exonuclease